jgi:hypothetical protein
MALVVTVMEWMGYIGNWRRTGIPDPHPLSEIWWHPFVVAPVFLVVMVLWPFPGIEE